MLVCLVMTFIVCDSVPVYTDLLMNPDDISTLVKAAVCITIILGQYSAYFKALAGHVLLEIIVGSKTLW